MKSPIKLFSLIMFGLAAIVWTANAIVNFIYREYIDFPILLGMNIICAVIWIIAFIINFIRYVNESKK